MKKLHRTKNAVKNHEELFPNHESKLQKTDPEFIELFDNWAFDEVIRQSKLDAKTRVMLILASTIASQALGEYKVMVGAALNVGLTPVEIKEILYQAVPYLGIAKVFDFLHATNEVLENNGVSRQSSGPIIGSHGQSRRNDRKPSSRHPGPLDSGRNQCFPRRPQQPVLRHQAKSSRLSHVSLLHRHALLRRRQTQYPFSTQTLIPLKVPRNL
jgi:alkylhydroperoxidase/carboxymuconolactone decarboxylase family protein YurZ